MWKRSVLIPIFVLIAAIGLFVSIRSGWLGFRGDASLPETDDAYVRADQTPLSTRISGTVRKVMLGDYQPVRAGQLIVELEDSDYQAAVEESKAALAGAKAELAANQSAKRVADASVRAAQEEIGEAQAASSAAQAGIDAVNADLIHAELEFRRQQSLLEHKAATRQQFEEAQANRDRAQATLSAKQADLSRANASVAASRAALVAVQQQRSALDTKDSVLQAQIAAKTAAITVAEVNLNYTKIYSPSNGTVGEFRVHPGQLVGAGVQVVDLVQSGVWIQANYRETQLGKVKPGDAVDVRIDAIPGSQFHGHVAEISPASGSQFALLPPDNATGNYTKVVQRIPVRIELDPSAQTAQMRPGFSAVVTIHATGGTDTHQASSSSAGAR